MNKTQRRIQEMLHKHPELEGPLRQYVPEVFAKDELFVSPGAIFIRKDFQKNLYVLSYCPDNGFRIVNVTSNKSWNKWYPASENLDIIGLTKLDFIELLKLSQVKLESIKFVGSHYIEDIHNKLFY